LAVSEFLCRAEQTVACVAHYDINPTHAGEGVVCDGADASLVRQVEDCHGQAIAMLLLEILEGSLPTHGGDDPIAAPQRALRHQPAEAG
jgi:hypothetical protein